MKEFTGYWTFFCNPKRWIIDDFLSRGETYDYLTVTDGHKDLFRKGQLGVVRVTHDRRTKEQLKGKEKLKRGIYAVVEILDEASLREEPEPSFGNENSLRKERYRVRVKFIKNLLNNPISIGSPIFEGENYDKHLIEGFQAATMPLKSETFKAIMQEIEKFESFDFNKENFDSKKIIEEISQKYADAVPEVKDQLSKAIERGKIAEKYKKITGFKCQICEALGKNPFVFRKRDGQLFIEVHHIIPVSNQQRGSLGVNNLITVCPNHHRQLHYGDVTLKKNDQDELELVIDNQTITIKKTNP